MDTYTLIITVIIEPRTKTDSNLCGGIGIFPLLQFLVCGIKRIPYHRIIALIIYRFFVSRHSFIVFFLLHKRHALEIIRITQLATL